MKTQGIFNHSSKEVKFREMKPITNLDYVELYARENNSLFAQQKKLIESQMLECSSTFKNIFGKNFKTNAKKYLRKVGLIKS